jgi:hypothetical protein
LSERICAPSIASHCCFRWPDSSLICIKDVDRHRMHA